MSADNPARPEVTDALAALRQMPEWQALERAAMNPACVDLVGTYEAARALVAAVTDQGETDDPTRARAT